MIKFFRKIRGIMLIENKFGKYFIYAIGEIILVIIGILIALSINNWNERQKLIETQQNLLSDLKVEVSSNLNILNDVIKRHETSLLGAQRIDSLFNDRERFNRMSEQSFSELFRKMNSNTTYQPNNGILNSIISSGQIKDIANKDLKYLLASIKEKTADAMELSMVIEKWRPELIGKIYKQSFNVVNGKIMGYDTRNLYDFADFRLYNSFLFGNLRTEGLGKEKELKKIFENILELIELEIEK